MSCEDVNNWCALFAAAELQQYYEHYDMNIEFSLHT